MSALHRQHHSHCIEPLPHSNSAPKLVMSGLAVTHPLSRIDFSARLKHSESNHFATRSRSAVEVTLAIEPALEIVTLRSAEFNGSNAKAWFCLSRQRTMPAQPATRYD
jgi:hypothetical protein